MKQKTVKTNPDHAPKDSRAVQGTAIEEPDTTLTVPIVLPTNPADLSQDELLKSSLYT